MIEYVKSEIYWPRWNELIFTERKPAIVFSVSKAHPAFSEVRNMLNTFKKTHVYHLQPRDFMKLLKGRDEYADPPCIIGYDKGECVFRYITENINGQSPVHIDLSDVNYELSKLFV